MSATVRVWDPFVRVFHWCLVASFAIAWLSAEDGRGLHQWAGYAAASLIALRLVWGIAGTRYARFSQFVRNPRSVAGYLFDILKGREARYLGHNPAGGLMIIALMVVMATLCLTGWLYTTDAFWGEEWVEETHEALANILLALVGLHVGGVIIASLRHRENLIRAMISGRKRMPGRGDITA
ncbi:MAG: cytochrome b/b6 domain-containing protein [Proteobacteria bacterium]|nr:cytochrome b/b6 domain-containing protein [Pseudomonadota bacterium]